MSFLTIFGLSFVLTTIIYHPLNASGIKYLVYNICWHEGSDIQDCFGIVVFELVIVFTAVNVFFFGYDYLK